MGGCSVSMSDGAEGIFVNPALLAELEWTELLGGYGRRCGAGQYCYSGGAAARPFRFGRFGLGYQRSQNACWGDALSIGYGRFLPYYVASVGFNAKLLLPGASPDDTVGCSGGGRTLGFDFGLLFRFLELSLGYSYHNLVVKELGAAADDDTKPRANKAFGLTYRRPEWIYWSLQTSSLHRFREDLGFGVEVWFVQTACGRIGIDRGMLTGGIGLDRERWALDVATLIDEELGNTYSASFKWRIGRRFLFE